MLFLRVIGKAFLFIAFVALAYDGARTLATPAQGIILSSLGSYLKTYSPGSLESMRDFFSGNEPSYLWTGLIEPMMVLPVSILLSAFGTLLFLAGYRKPPPEIVRE